MKKRKAMAIVLSLIMLLSMFSASTAFADTSGAKIVRMGGSNRYETSTLIVGQGWKTADAVVLANGDDFADALAGVPLAAALDAPILVTKANKIEPVVLNKIKALGVKKIYILGGTGAISKTAEKQLSGYQIERIAGDTRYETSVLIAKKLQSVTGKKPTEVFMVYAFNYPDALAISSVAGINKNPIIYVPGTGSLNSGVSNYLQNSGCSLGTILGGTAVINVDVANSIRNNGITTLNRVYGANRYETCIKICERYASSFVGSDIAVATGTAFPDALAGGVYATKMKVPIVLVNNSSSVKDLHNYVRGRWPSTVYAFGGQGAVSDKTINNLFKLYKDPAQKITLYHEGNLPAEFSFGPSPSSISTKMKIKEVNYTVNVYDDGTCSLSLEIPVQKTYDYEGNNATNACYAMYRVKNENGDIIDTGLVCAFNLHVGDTYYCDSVEILNLEEGVYIIEFEDW